MLNEYVPGKSMNLKFGSLLSFRMMNQTRRKILIHGVDTHNVLWSEEEEEAKENI